MRTIEVSKRGCGFPKEGGFYAIGGGRAMTCYALPMELQPCGCCMQMPKFARCPTQVTSEYLHMLFAKCEATERCNQCVKDRKYWISWIGSDYDTKSFNEEVDRQGLSRRIPPSFAKSIQVGDYFANVKNGKIISMVPITSVRYYVKPEDDATKIETLEKDGIEVCKLKKVETENVEQLEIE
jgi:hypothetical protein